MENNSFFSWEALVLWLAEPVSAGSDLLIVELLTIILVVAVHILLFYYIIRRKRRIARIIAAEKALAKTSQETPDNPPEALPAAASPASGPTPSTALDTVLAPAPGWKSALERSRAPLLLRLQDATKGLLGGGTWGPEHPLWESLEEILLGADLGPRLSQTVLAHLRRDFREKPEPDFLRERLRQHLRDVLVSLPSPNTTPESGPRVTVLIGINGSGKTTTAGKLASQRKAEGKLVVLGAGDTFRAAAVEQLKTWADRIGVECILPAKGANPAAVAFDAVAAGLARGAQEIIIDTAGRLHTKDSLMEELKKVIRIIDKKLPGAPHEVLLVLDSTLGQNALIQAREFAAAVRPTGVVLTKLDGSSKGGAAFAVVAELGIPITYVGLGEGANDLAPFSPEDFVENLVPSAICV